MALIYKTKSEITLNYIKTLLDRHGIGNSPDDWDEPIQDLDPFMRIYVQEDCLEKATALLSKFKIK